MIFPHKTFWLLPLVSGLLLTLTTPWVDLGLLAWIGLVPLLIFIRSDLITTRQALLGSILTGSLYGMAVLWPLRTLNAWWWVYPSGFIWDHREGILVTVLLLTAIVAGGLFFGFFGYLYRRWHTDTLWDAALFASLWVLMERLREPLVAGFTWGHLGYSMHDMPLVLQSASFLGVYGISGLIVAVNILLFMSIRTGHALYVQKREIGKIWLKKAIFKNYALLFLIILLVGIHTYGYVVLKHHSQHSKELRVAVIHSPYTTEEGRLGENYEATLARITAALKEQPDIIITPENIFPFFIIDTRTGLPLEYNSERIPIKQLYDKLVSLSLSYPATALVLGMHSDTDGNRFNSLVVMELGAITDLYAKQVLLPLAESVPERLAASHVSPLQKGKELQHILAKDVRISPLICSEVIYPRALGRDKKSDLIINASNDSIFRSPLVTQQNFAIAQVRAAEHQRYLLRSSKQGLSGIVDPNGRIVAATQNPDGDILFATISY